MALVQTQGSVLILPLGFAIRSSLHLFPPLTSPTPVGLVGHTLKAAEPVVLWTDCRYISCSRHHAKLATFQVSWCIGWNSIGRYWMYYLQNPTQGGLTDVIFHSWCRGEKCSNFSFALGSVSQHAPDLWTPEHFHSVQRLCISIGFISTIWSELLYQSLQCASHLLLSPVCHWYNDSVWCPAGCPGGPHFFRLHSDSRRINKDLGQYCKLLSIPHECKWFLILFSDWNGKELIACAMFIWVLGNLP